MKYHFIGLGGIGMSALARVLLQKGENVQGSDVQKTGLLESLEREGAFIQVGQAPERILKEMTVVYSSGIPKDHPELQHARGTGATVYHRAELLNQLFGRQKPLLVAGTHGKTTTSALLAWVLLQAGIDPSFAVGGILLQINQNGKFGQGPFFVAEADESDGSFLKMRGFGAIVTNVDKEHLDFWKEYSSLQKAFSQFLGQIESPAHLVWCVDDSCLRELNPPGISYGFDPKAGCRISSCESTEKGMRFDLVWENTRYSQMEISLFGRHNVLNSAAVFALARSLSIPEEKIREAFSSFPGVHRRLEWRGCAQTVDLYDDYAHHPTEIAGTLLAMRERVRERRLIAIFQPHRYTRVESLFEEFLECFSKADRVILTDIYEAGETPLEGVTSAKLVKGLLEKGVKCVEFVPRDELEDRVIQLAEMKDVLLLLGAGDISSAGEGILQGLKSRVFQIQVALILGGRSSEHEISLSSAKSIANHLDPSLYRIRQFHITQEGQWKSEGLTSSEKGISSEILQQLCQSDVCIPALHGPYGEDGMIQGFLQTLGIPYVGCDYRSCAICMNKAWTKQTVIFAGIPTAPFLSIDRIEWQKDATRVQERILSSFSFPFWIKPVHLGSSLGIQRVMNEEMLFEALLSAFASDEVLLVEKEVKGREIEFALLGNEWIRIAVPGEILNEGAFYDYEKKYGEGGCLTQVPALLSPCQSEIGQYLAKQAYMACGCKGFARVDFFLDEEGHFWFNEINPFPGCTPISLYPKMWQGSGMSFSELCNEWIVLALQRARAVCL